MPHLSIQYSRNLEERLDMPGLLRVLRDAAVETGVFPPAGIRVRAFAADHVLIADGDPRHGFIDISIRLRGGRSPQDKARATAHVLAIWTALAVTITAKENSPSAIRKE